MKKQTVITSQDIRTALLDRAVKYRETTGVSFSRMSTAALGDNKFLANVQAGKNFTVSTYQRMLDWLDKQEVTGLSAHNRE